MGLSLETPLWEIFTRATFVYLALAVVIRLVPKRHTVDLAPNDWIAMIVIAGIAGDAIKGDANTALDLLLMIGVSSSCGTTC